MSLNHINEELIDDICLRLWSVEGSLRGVGALFEQGASDPCFEAEEVFGVGQLLKSLSQELSGLEGVLRYGRNDQLKVESESN